MRSIRRSVARILAAAAALASFVAARDAAACFDGYVATIGKVQLMRGLAVASWSPADARHAARWGARIDAILPAGAHLEVTTNEARCASDSGACGGVTTIAAGSKDLPGLFAAVATAFRVDPSRVRAARSLAPTLYTVQLFAGSARGAAAMKARVAALGAGAHGFFVEGGFPASNETAHVLRDGAAPHRVVVGVFLSRSDADAARAEVAAQGFRGFTRELPPGEPVGEQSFTLLG